MENTIRLTEKEAADIIELHFRGQGHEVRGAVRFVCTDNYPSAKDYEGNWVQAVVVTVAARPAPTASPVTGMLAAQGY